MSTTNTIPFLATFITGLVLGVVAMFNGVLVPTHGGHADVPWQRRILPDLSAFGVTFGVVGYTLAQETSLAAAAILAMAGAAGVAMFGLVHSVVGRWASLPHDRQREEAEDLQGQLGTVVRAIRADEHGEVAYELYGQRFVVPASVINGGSLPAGTDVVLDRIEEGVAYVEPWSTVEERL